MNILEPLIWKNNFTRSAFHQYLIRKDPEARKNSKSQYQVAYGRINTQQSFDVATEFTTINEAKEWCWGHYSNEMKPYIKPLPNKVYELTYDCGDNYFTVFMTLDKQIASDFIENVKKYDDQYAQDMDCTNDPWEVSHEYDENHPLKSYSNKIFGSSYEDSFSEYADNYIGESFASQLQIIEHEIVNISI